MNNGRLSDWPRENGVVSAIAETIRSQGVDADRLCARYDRQRGVDVEATLPNGLALICEAKGEPPTVRTSGSRQGETKTVSQVNLDRLIGFRDGLGLLIERMANPEPVFALGVPMTDGYCSLLPRRLPAWVRKLLWIHCLLAKASGEVLYLAPDQSYPQQEGDWLALPLLTLECFTDGGDRQ